MWPPCLATGVAAKELCGDPTRTFQPVATACIARRRARRIRDAPLLDDIIEDESVKRRKRRPSIKSVVEQAAKAGLGHVFQR